MSTENTPSKKVVLVTGASRGIGLLTAKTLANSGYRTFAAMRDTGGRNSIVARELSIWAEENGLVVEPVELDVTDDRSVERAV